MRSFILPTLGYPTSIEAQTIVVQQWFARLNENGQLAPKEIIRRVGSGDPVVSRFVGFVVTAAHLTKLV